MCLVKVDSSKKKNKGTGYKIFKKFGNIISPLVFYWDIEGDLKIDKWYQDLKEGLIFDDDFKSYPMGFHIFNKKPRKSNRLLYYYKYCKTNRSIEIRKVRFKEVVATGMDISGDRTIVARQIYIVPTIRERIRKLFTGEYKK